jgi:hypothetical protein
LARLWESGSGFRSKFSVAFQKFAKEVGSLRSVIRAKAHC